MSSRLAARALSPLRQAALLTAGSVGLLLLNVGAAAATSCAGHPDGSPTAIAAGRERLASLEPFFSTYSHALIGTVTDIAFEWEDEHTLTRVVVRFDVHATLGPVEPSPTMVVTAPDDGGMLGYGFEAGRTYFVPVAFTDDDREHSSSLCDPISHVDDPDALVATLRPLAEESGVALWEPDDGIAVVPAAVTAVAIAAAAVILLLLRRRVRPTVR